MLGRTQPEEPEAAQPPPEQPASNVERRAWVRLPCDINSHCRPSIGSDEEHWSARILDISQGGIRLLLDRRFEPKTILNIQIEVQGEEAVAFIAQVVHIDAESADRWSLGCRFPKPISEKEVEAVLAFKRSE